MAGSRELGGLLLPDYSSDPERRALPTSPAVLHFFLFFSCFQASARSRSPSQRLVVLRPRRKRRLGWSPRRKAHVLDLDETLVCAYETCSVPAIVRAQATEAGMKWFEIECLSSEKESDGKPKINYVTVFERPGLREFLKRVSEFADLAIFTAGLEDYARPLVDRIDVENLFQLRLYRASRVSTECREHVKDLSCLSKDFSRIVIVDNNPFSFLLQPLNGIPCVPFSAGIYLQFKQRDEQLSEVCSDYTLLCLSFRHVDYTAFGGAASASQAALLAKRCQTYASGEIRHG
ncbi:phosphatase Herzog-like isoform X2 [Pyrus x bretschneideri]|uniref:phosphatase Herzog-like isoform X2 n=1 Tax=Pyrus x bretschneideri TaxID=225117 RepID=UPI0020306431|nr:phosphatase Herzog-like isoform X2 [Pyrus x bretschneideri]